MNADDILATLADADPDRGQSWVPPDLTPYLTGRHNRSTPTMGLARTDGLRLIYPGKEHTVIGEMESAKSWFTTASAAVELETGVVVYIHFEEADPADTVERLQALQVPDPVILDRFHFVGPDEPVTPSRLQDLLDLHPTLVILDGVNEAMSMHAMLIRDEDGAAAFRRRLVKPFTRTGATTLAADHVVKDKEKRDRGPLGSIHKGNGLTGSLILLENVEPFGRGMRGASHVFITKDRPGYLRRHGQRTKVPGKTYMGSLVVDDTRIWHEDRLDLTFLAPADKTGTEEDPANAADPNLTDDAAVLAVVEKLLAADPDAANMRAIRAQSGISKDRTAEALERLVFSKRLSEHRGPRNSRIFTGPEDQLSLTRR